MTYNSSKANGWCINHNHRNFVRNQSSKSVLFIGSLQAIIYLANASNTLITVVRVINFTVVHCVYIIVLLHLFCYKPVFIPLLTKDRDMHAYVHSWCQMMVTETVKQPTFGPVSFLRLART